MTIRDIQLYFGQDRRGNGINIGTNDLTAEVKAGKRESAKFTEREHSDAYSITVWSEGRVGTDEARSAAMNLFAAGKLEQFGYREESLRLISVEGGECGGVAFSKRVPVGSVENALSFL